MVTIRFKPIIKFLLRINFNSIENPTIQTLTEISENLSREGYSHPTKINLISSKGPDPQLIFAPIRFLSEEVGNEISIFRDSIYFQYNEKYSSWDDQILPDILKNFLFLSEKLNIPEIKSISLDYIDLFDELPQRGFQIRSYFNIYLQRPPVFDLDYEDFIMGIKLKTEESNHKSILRIRGLKPDNEENYKIQLETHFSIVEDNEITAFETFKNNLNLAHDVLLENFKLVLTEKTKKLIVMENGTNS